MLFAIALKRMINASWLHLNYSILYQLCFQMILDRLDFLSIDGHIGSTVLQVEHLDSSGIFELMEILFFAAPPLLLFSSGRPCLFTLGFWNSLFHFFANLSEVLVGNRVYRQFFALTFGCQSLYTVVLSLAPLKDPVCEIFEDGSRSLAVALEVVAEHRSS